MITHLYSVYGLYLNSNRELGVLSPASNIPEDNQPVNLKVVEEMDLLPIKQPKAEPVWYAHPYQDDNGIPILQVWRNGEYYYLAYLHGGHFVISRDGGNIWVALTERTNFDFIIAQIAGPILGLVLQLKGYLVFHASVVAWEDYAFAIIGMSGTGKSTLAAELHRQGCKILSDDIAGLTYENDIWHVQPGYPRLRLWPHAASALFGPNHQLRPIAPEIENWDKRYLELDTESANFTASSLPLRSIYVLNWVDDGNQQIRIEPLTHVEALSNLDINCFMGYLLDQEQRQRQIADIRRLLDQVGVFQVQPIADLTALQDLGKAILMNFTGIP